MIAAHRLEWFCIDENVNQQKKKDKKGGFHVFFSVSAALSVRFTFHFPA